ncbi:hypothetical protein SAMN03159434_102494 [Enterobacter sp. NFR05]|nr:hypothetical protein SAMN03159434_102494 [Enterobacter sp. NFR05]
MIEIEEVTEQLPADGRVLITCKNGVICSVRQVHENEHVATLNALIEIAKMAGYTITKNGCVKV